MYKRGEKILLAFHPLARTKRYEKPMKLLEENYERFRSMNSVAFGISVDSTPCKKAGAREQGIENTMFMANFRPHDKVVSMYGMFGEKGRVSERASILVDDKLGVKFVKVYEKHTLTDIDEIFDAMRG